VDFLKKVLIYSPKFRRKNLHWRKLF